MSNLWTSVSQYNYVLFIKKNPFLIIKFRINLKTHQQNSLHLAYFILAALFNKPLPSYLLTHQANPCHDFACGVFNTFLLVSGAHRRVGGVRNRPHTTYFGDGPSSPQGEALLKRLEQSFIDEAISSR